MKRIEYFYYSQDGFTFFQNSHLDQELISNLDIHDELNEDIRVASVSQPEQSYDTLYLNGDVDTREFRFLISHENEDCYFRTQWISLISAFNKGLI